MNKKVILLIIFQLLSFTTYKATAKGFKFAIITDTHLSSGNPKPAEDLQLSVNQINATPNIDFVLVTGDITENGDRASLLHAKSILDRLHIKYYIIPGNHETKWSESGMTDFAQIFGSERFDFEHQDFRFLGFNTGPLMRMAYGHVVPQDITWLKQELEKAGKDRPIVLVTHYPIQEGDVDNWYELTDAVRPYNIRMFIGGHYHSNRQLSYDGIPGILIRSNLRDKDDIGGYGIAEVTSDSILIYNERIGEPKQKWAALSLHHTYYPRAGKATKYPDFSVNQKFPQVKYDWLLHTGIGIYSSPYIYKDRVYIGDDMGYLSCYTLKEGHKCWSFQSKQRIVGTPAAADGVVVFGSADNHIYGLDSQTGVQKWKTRTNAPVLGAVSIENGVAYIGASDHTFRAIHMQTGKIVWEYTQVKGYIETKPLLTKDEVVFGAWDNTLYALQKKNGTERWKWTGGLTRIHFSPAAVWPVYANNKVFIADPQRALTAIDQQTGETIWRTFQSQVRETIGISTDKKRLYAKTMNDSIVCYSTAPNTAVKLWSTNVGFGYEHAPSMLIEKNNILFGSTKEGVIFAVKAKSGEVVWIHKVGNSLVNTVLPIGSQKLLFTTTNGEVGLLNWRN